MALATILMGAMPAVGAQLCAEIAGHGDVTRALREIETAVDPCGESAEIAALLSSFRRCVGPSYRICVDHRSERNYIERGGEGNALPTTITWNPTLTTALEPVCPGDPHRDVRRDPLASLLHEVVHAVQHCTGLDPADHELEAVRVENIYRRARGLCQRTRYGEELLSSALAVSCDPGNCTCRRSAAGQVMADVASPPVNSGERRPDEGAGDQAARAQQ